MFNQKTFDILRPTTTAGDKTAYTDTTRDIIGRLTPTENAFSAVGVGGYAKSWTLFSKDISADVKEGDRLKVSASEQYDVRGVQVYNHPPKHIEIMLEEVIKQGGVGSVDPEEPEEYDTDAQTFIDAVTNGGDTLSTAQQDAINQLVEDLKEAGIWSKFYAIYPIVGGTATAHRWNLKAPGTLSATFNGSPTHSSSGIQFNGTSQWANTGLSDDTIPQNDIGLDFYSRSNVPGSGDVDMGVYNTSYFLTSYQNNFYVALRNNQIGPIGSAYVDTRGLLSIQRTDANTVIAYRNGSSVYSNGALPSIAPINQNICFGGVLVAGGSVPSYYSSKQFAFVGIRSKFTTQEMTDYYTAVQAYQTALGRQV